jgi:hypothetical protein
LYRLFYHYLVFFGQEINGKKKYGQGLIKGVDIIEVAYGWALVHPQSSIMFI